MLVTLEFDRHANTGRYSAVLAAERLRAKGIPFNEVIFDGCCQVRMTLQGDRTTMEFTGTVAADSLTGSIEETLRGGEASAAALSRMRESPASTHRSRSATSRLRMRM